MEITEHLYTTLPKDFKEVDVDAGVHALISSARSKGATHSSGGSMRNLNVEHRFIQKEGFEVRLIVAFDPREGHLIGRLDTFI
jgi:hypothetical protein